MADVDLTIPKVFKAAEGEEEVIQNSRCGGLVTVVRGEKGKFARKAKTMPKTADLTRLMRNLLNQAEAGSDGRMRRGDKSRMRVMLDNMVSIASMPAEQPIKDRLGNVILDSEGRPVTEKDPKVAMAAAKAYEILMLRAYGKPANNEEEIEALKQQGVKMVVILPPEMANKEVIEDKPRTRPIPAFLDAEIVTNPKLTPAFLDAETGTIE